MEKLKNHLNNLDSKNTSQDTDIPEKMIKEQSDLFDHFRSKDYNNMLIKSQFRKNPKIVKVTPVYKRNSQNDKTNYCPVSILSNLSKVYEKCIFDEMACLWF